MRGNGEEPWVSRYRKWSGLCARREYAASEIRERLFRQGADAAETEAVLAELIRHGFQSDERYARAFVRDKSRLAGWGARKIRAALTARRIADGIVEEVLREAESPAAEERLARLLEVKWNAECRRPETDRETAWRKTVRYALGRGYGYGEVCRTLARLVGTFPEQNGDRAGAAAGASEHIV